MQNDINLEEARELLKDIDIPPQPKLLTEINKEFNKFDPSAKKIADLVARDVGVSASVLKVVNSSFFGLRSKVSSISGAVYMLGMENVKCIVTGLMLKGAMGGGQAVTLERFWDASEKNARIATYIASLLPNDLRDETYTFGLFRECGILLLMQRFPDYKETLRLAEKQSEIMTVIEDQRHAINHATVGFMVAKTWGLPESICTAILRHHDYEIYSAADSVDPLALTLVSINFLTEYVNDEVLLMQTNPAWETVGDAVLKHLGISGEQLIALREDIYSVIES